MEETKEEVAKRKKGVQGIPTVALKDQNKLMKFIAQVVYLKKDDKYLSEQVFMEAAKLLEDGKGDFAKILERAIHTQINTIKDKGQKLYTCVPMWQELYRQVAGESQVND